MIRRVAKGLLRRSDRILKADVRYLLESNFWLTASRFIGVGVGIIFTVTVANILSQTEFGIYKYVIGVAGIVSLFSLNGIGTAVTRAAAQGKEGVTPLMFRQGILWSLPASLVSLGASIYYFAQINPVLGTGFLLIALTTPFLNALVLSKSILYGKSNFKAAAYYSAPRSMFPIFAMIAVVFFTHNVLILIITYFTTNLLASGLMYWHVSRKYALKESSEHLKETLDYSKHLSVLGLFMQGVGQLDTIIIWHFVGPIPLAIYSFAQAPIRELRNFSENFFPIIFPKLANKTIVQVKETLPLRIGQMFVVSIGIMGAYIIAAPYIFQFLFPQYMSSVLLSQLVALTLLLQPKGLVETFLIAHGEVKLRYVVTAITQISRLALMLILIPLYGIYGAVCAILASETISALALLYAYKKMN